jgi:hypothetical protein
MDNIQAAPHRWHGMVDQTIPEHRTAEGPKDQQMTGAITA